MEDILNSMENLWNIQEIYGNLWKIYVKSGYFIDDFTYNNGDAPWL